MMSERALRMVELGVDLLLISAQEHNLPDHTKDICHNVGRDMLQWVRGSELGATEDERRD